MARRKTIEEMLNEAEAGKSGRNLGEQKIKEWEREEEKGAAKAIKDEVEKDKKKKKRGWFEGRRDKRTVLSAEEDA